MTRAKFQFSASHLAPRTSHLGPRTSDLQSTRSSYRGRGAVFLGAPASCAFGQVAGAPAQIPADFG
eukprot:14461422-Alexandrium_andersonii.AAC.1